MPITILSQPDCRPCAQAKTFFSTRGVDFVERDVTVDSEARELLNSLGYKSTPVIIAGEDHWNGLNLAKMRELVAA